jgi:hypothetical protein
MGSLGQPEGDGCDDGDLAIGLGHNAGGHRDWQVIYSNAW